MNLLSDVLNNYLDTYKNTGGKAIDIQSPSQMALMGGLKDFFKDVVESSTYPIDRYTFKGSYGQPPLNMADIPWVATMDRRVTSSAQRGFDVVLLFAKDMKSCALSLNQGYKAYLDAYKKESLALKMIRQTAEKAVANLPPIPGATYGPIDLKATSKSKGYEVGAIASYIYEIDSLPTEAQFTQNYLYLLSAYDHLFNLAGKDLMSLKAMTDSEFQSAIEETLAREPAAMIDQESVGPEERPPLLPLAAGAKYKRDVDKSTKAIERSGFSCEANFKHESFTSYISKKRYLEAHHLIPMALQGQFNYSLDIAANIIALCPNCHRQIHHGIYSEKIKLIKHLFSSRKDELLKKGVDIAEADLLKIYKRKIEETD